MIVTSFQDLKLCGKRIFQSFSDCELINSPKNGTKVHCLEDHNHSQSPVLVSRFCTPHEVKFDAFGSSKLREGKSLPKYFFAILISTLCRFYRANRKKSVIYTLMLNEQ